jgi:hypothetical protein
MSDEVESVIVKGEQCARVSLKRNRKGLRVTVKAHEALEDLMRAWAGGHAAGVSAGGRYWQAIDEEPLRAYPIPDSIQTMESAGGRYRMDLVGQPLMGSDGVLNLAFLRLAGVSSPAGLTFQVVGVFSDKELRNIAEAIRFAIRQFYMDYLLPVTIHITMSTEELRA